MCGIWGGIGLRLQRPDLFYGKALRHRGPDSQGSVEINVGDQSLWMGHTRLAIIDTRAIANQPMWNQANNLCVVFNGEIYNFRELRTQWCAHYAFLTNSDTEVLLALWERLGPDCLNLLRGMFAFAVHDVRARKTFLCRDQLGIKPLYYMAEGGKRFAFASEATALAWAETDRQVSSDAVASFLWTRYVPGPATIFRGLHKLPPASYAEWSPAMGIRVFQYWTPPTEERNRSGKDTVMELRERLATAVRAQLVADVPLGVFISGGLDSGLLASLAAPHLKGRFEAFSIGFDDPAYDESEAATLIARACGATHHLIRFRGTLKDWLPRVAARLDEPLADPATLPTYALSEFARQRVTVALSGDGADELFGGYKQYRLESLAPLLRPVRRAIRMAFGLLGWNERRERLVRALDSSPLDRGTEWTGVMSKEAVRWLVGALPGANAEPDVSTGPTGLMRADLLHSLPDRMLMKTDRMSMAHSLEVRVPFLDLDVADLACKLPLEFKVRPWADKIILRRVARSVVAPAVYRRRKHGFNLPISEWLRATDSAFCRDTLLAKNTGVSAVVSVAEIKKYIDEHMAGKRDHGLTLFALLTLALWFESACTRPPAVI